MGSSCKVGNSDLHWPRRGCRTGFVWLFSSQPSSVGWVSHLVLGFFNPRRLKLSSLFSPFVEALWAQPAVETGEKANEEKNGHQQVQRKNEVKPDKTWRKNDEPYDERETIWPPAFTFLFGWKSGTSWPWQQTRLLLWCCKKIRFASDSGELCCIDLYITTSTTTTRLRFIMIFL